VLHGVIAMPLSNRKTKTVFGSCFCVLVLAFSFFTCCANDLGTMGVDLVRASQPILNGAGIDVAQPEAPNSTNTAEFEVNYATAGDPETLFTWISGSGTAFKFPNAVGIESSHADEVANCFYGPSWGVAPGVAHVDNYEGNYFYQNIVLPGVPIGDDVVNQSFSFSIGPPSQQPVDSAYDDYIADNGMVFCSAVNGLGTNVGPPGTAYNGTGVGAYGNGAVVCDGPTLDNGRCKPDIVAPGTAISFTTPYVAGAAAVLLQAAGEGDGGANITDACDERTIKALLLNGALKPFDWTNTTTSPLDFRYGAGVVNLYYSDQQLSGGEFGYTSQTTVSAGAEHPPISTGPAIGSLAGWDFESVASDPTGDTVNHYFFNISSNSTLTATLVWERPAGMTNIDNLALFLYNASNATLVTSSASLVDNVQHVYIPHLAPGSYDLEAVTCARVLTETYALAFQFFAMSPPTLSASFTATNATITWPWSPTVYTLQQASSLNPAAIWSNVASTEWITNSTVLTSVNLSGSATFFRLVR
jgi:hypothetical protein